MLSVTHKRGRVLARHAWTQLPLTHLLAQRPGTHSQRHTCRQSVLTHSLSMYNSLLFGTLQRLLASAGSVLLRYTNPEVNCRKKKAAKGLLNKSISRVSLSACLCVFVPRPREREICTSLLVGMWERTIVYISIYGDPSNMHYFKTWRKTGQPLQHSQKNVFFICS